MKFTKALQRTYYAAGVLTALSACASNPTSDASLVAEKAQALGVLDCQNKAAECLGTLPSPDKISSCRDEIKSCIDELQTAVEQKVGDLGQCVSDAQTCAQGADAFSDLMTCRDGFEACAGSKVDLGDVPVPSFPMLPEELGAALESANKCREDAVSCVKAGGKSPSELATCADAYRGCVVELLPAPSADASKLPSLPPELTAAIDSASKCNDAALSCVKAASDSPSEIAACADTYHSCIGELLPKPSGDASKAPTLPPEVTTAIEGADKCREAASSCVEAAGDSPSDIATCAETYGRCVADLIPAPSGGEGGFELPGLPTIDPDGKGADCLEQLGECLKSGKSPADCATEASTCIGVPEVSVPAFPFAPAPKQP